MIIIEIVDHELAELARKNGCDPRWSTYYEAYCCPCEDHLHVGDSPCSVISAESAKHTRPGDTNHPRLRSSLLVPFEDSIGSKRGSS